VCGQTISVAPGSTATFTVRASDAQSAVELNATGVPATAILTPGLPSSGNPASTTFQWTPTIGDLGQHVVTFTATDQCAPTLCAITIDVSSEVCDDGADNDGDLLADCADPDCDDVACDDGAFCTINDSCRMGACGGDPNPCDDGNACTADTCSGAACANPPKTAGTSCDDDGDACTVDQCNGAGACVPQSVVSCPGPTACDGGQSCNPASGLCEDDPDTAAGTSCADTDGNVCTAAGCNGAGGCNQSYALSAAGTSCADTDGNVCTAAGCNGAGGCNQSYALSAAGTSCPDTDGSACTTAACNGAGVCNQSHSVVSCVGPTACDGGQSCNPGSGQCEPAPDPAAGTPCADTDGAPCTSAACNGTGTCDQNFTLRPAETPCEADGNLCTADRCDGAGTCTVGAAVTCQSADGQCEGGEACNPATGGCEPLPDAPAGTPCDDGRRCLINESCDGFGKCQLADLAPECLGGFKCYKTVQINPPFGKLSVSLVDTFITTDAEVRKPRRVCNPADIADDGFVGDPTAHMMCYRIKVRRFAERHVIAEDRFGQQTLAVNTTDTLCLPAEMALCQGPGGQCDDPAPSALEINHLKCYSVYELKACLGGFDDGVPCIDDSECESAVCTRKEFESRELSVVDGFETKATIVRRPKMLCTPVEKNGEPDSVVDSEKNLLCYKIKDVRGQRRFERQFFQTVDQFGEIDPLRAIRGSGLKASLLCVSAFIRPL
jgi:hypothetical protein